MSAATTLLERLRQATREQHQQLDRHPLLRPLIQPGIQPTQYLAALAALHGPTAYLEQQVQPLFEADPTDMERTAPPRNLKHLLAAPGLGARDSGLEICHGCFTVSPGYSPRISVLEQDLTRLQVDCPMPTLAPPPAYQGPAITLNSRPLRIGGLYVLEGSRMGGFAIAQRLAQDLPQLSRDFFGNGGRRGWPDYWPPLLEGLDPSDQAETLHGAQQAFEVFIQHLNRVVSQEAGLDT
jgi:heme oxygenase